MYVVNVDKPTGKALIHFAFCEHYLKRESKDPANGYWTEPIGATENAFDDARSSGMREVRWAKCCEDYERLRLTVELFRAEHELNETTDLEVLWQFGHGLAYRSAFYELYFAMKRTPAFHTMTVQSALEHVKTGLRPQLVKYVEANMHRAGLPNPRRDKVAEGIDAAISEITEETLVVD